MDIFDNIILCKDCGVRMQKVKFERNGFIFRAVQCTRCGNKIIHPDDKQEYKKYVELKRKNFNVKLRMVGNSYTVSIPREIVNFINEQNKVIDELVSLSFDKMGKLSLMFNDIIEEAVSEDGEDKKNKVIEFEKIKHKKKK